MPVFHNLRNEQQVNPTIFVQHMDKNWPFFGADVYQMAANTRETHLTPPSLASPRDLTSPDFAEAINSVAKNCVTSSRNSHSNS